MGVLTARELDDSMPNFMDLDFSTFVALTVYSMAVVFASVFGGLLPEWIRLTHTRMQLMISFVGGVMLGIAVFHMIPHSLAAVGAAHVDQITMAMMFGLIATFFLLRFSHFHQHGPADFGNQTDEASEEDHEAATTHLCSGHDHSATIHPHGDGCEQTATGEPTRWMAVLLGLGLHTLMDGVALGAATMAEASLGHHSLLPGFGIFLAVVLHKPLDAVSITSLMHPVTTRRTRLAVNIGFALLCPLGAILFVSGMAAGGEWSASLAGWGLAFSAGVFLCISLSDLLPEMEFHSHNRIPLSVALLLGIAAAWAIGLVEGEHSHQHVESGSPHSVPHQHDH